VDSAGKAGEKLNRKLNKNCKQRAVFKACPKFKNTHI